MSDDHSIRYGDELDVERTYHSSFGSFGGSQNAATILANATTQISNHINNISNLNSHATNSLAISNFGIPLAGTMAMGLAVGFIKDRLKVMTILTKLIEAGAKILDKRT